VLAEARIKTENSHEKLRPIAGRHSRKLGGFTLRSIGDIARHQRLRDNDALYVSPPDMIVELCEDNQRFITSLRQARHVCNEHGDMASASLIDNLSTRRKSVAWFLYEAGRGGQCT
jgi:starvation-inducible DNA-binding protein